MRFLNDFEGTKLHTADQCQSSVPDEELGDLLIGKIAAGKIEPKSLGGHSGAVGKLNTCVEVGAVLGHRG